MRPGQLGEGAPTGVVNVIDGKAGAIQRADVATFLLKAVTDTSFAYVRKAVSISSVLGLSWKKDAASKDFDGVTKDL